MILNKLKIYLDTSVIIHLFQEIEFLNPSVLLESGLEVHRKIQEYKLQKNYKLLIPKHAIFSKLVKSIMEISNITINNIFSKSVSNKNT